MDHAGAVINATNAVAATTITVLGVATGLSYEVLLAGFAGGIVSLSFLGQMSLWRRVWTPVVATLTAGYTAPVWFHYLAKWLLEVNGPVDPSMPTLAPLTLLLFTAFAIGASAQVLIPAALGFVKRKAGSYGADSQ